MNRIEDKPVSLVAPEKIAFDDKNPRGETEEQIEKDAEFKELRESVKRHGILVPLIVRKNGNAVQPYKLVDGERRLRAALAEKIDNVPVHLIEGEECDGRVLAYNIHMLRKQWDKKCELNSIREIMGELHQGEPDITDAELFSRLKEITNHKEHDLKTLLTLLQYDDATVKKVQDGSLAMSFLVQIESSFLSPLKREFPRLYAEIGEQELRAILVKKAEDGKLGNTRYLMDNVLKFFREGNKIKLKNALKKFLRDPDEQVSSIVKKMKGPEKARKRHRKTDTAKTASRQEKASVPGEFDRSGDLVSTEKKVIQDGIFNLLFNYLREAVIEYEKRTNTKFRNESEIQNFIYSLLRALFASVEFEDPTEKKCGTSNRLDFVIKDHKIIIEVKYVRDQTHGKKVADELAADYLRYGKSPYGKTIMNYIYDPNKAIGNQVSFKKQLKELMPEALHYVQ